MAIVIFGRTLCAVCGKPLLREGHVVAFPAIVPNAKSPLRDFNDAAVHDACFQRHPFGPRATKLLQTYAESCPPPRRCLVCGEVIAHPNDYFGTGLLADDPDDPLYSQNFLHFHRSHCQDWPGWESLRRSIEELQTSDRWEGPRVVFDPLPTWRPAQK